MLENSPRPFLQPLLVIIIPTSPQARGPFQHTWGRDLSPPYGVGNRAWGPWKRIKLPSQLCFSTAPLAWGGPVPPWGQDPSASQEGGPQDCCGSPSSHFLCFKDVLKIKSFGQRNSKREKSTSISCITIMTRVNTRRRFKAPQCCHLLLSLSKRERSKGLPTHFTTISKKIPTSLPQASRHQGISLTCCQITDTARTL